LLHSPVASLQRVHQFSPVISFFFGLVEAQRNHLFRQLNRQAGMYNKNELGSRKSIVGE
jgi:hypothetical protein